MDGRRTFICVVVILIVLTLVAPLLASDGYKSKLSILDFVPSYGHFRRGEWQKGISDLWNVFMVVWAIAEPNETISRWQRDVDEGYCTGTVQCKVFSDNIPIMRQFQYCMLGLAIIDYVNSLLDLAHPSRDSESFFGAFGAYDVFNYDTFVTTPLGFQPYDGADKGIYGGLIFGYRSTFEWYMKMFLPQPGVSYSIWYTDYVIPSKRWDGLTYYLGVGACGGSYKSTLDWNRVSKVVEGGIGLHLRLGASYRLSDKHFVRLTLAPVTMWQNIRAFDKKIYEDRSGSDYSRLTRGCFPKNFGFQLLYRYNISSRFYIETLFSYSRATEHEDDYTELLGDGTTLHIHRNEQTSYRRRLDVSLNWRF